MFKRKAIEAAEIKWEDANEFNEYLYDLKKYQVKEIKVKGDLKRSKIAWKIAIYSQAMRYRLIELAEACIDEWDKERFVACFILARSIIETVSVLYEFELRLEKALISQDIYIADKIITHKIFSTRLGDLFKERPEIEAVSILTVINKIDKKTKGLREEYDRLSEYAHTNYFGVINAYEKIDYKTGNVSFGNQNNKHSVFMRLQSVFMLFGIAKCTFDKIDLQIKLAAKLQTAKED